MLTTSNKTTYSAQHIVDLIDETIKKDQGASFRGWLGKVIPHMGDAYRSEEESHRSHMGASLLGGPCERAIWLDFRWAKKSSFEGRLLRLFNRGHLEEARFIAMLLMIGCKVYQQDQNGKQYRISFAEGHAGGSGDGIALCVPSLDPNQPCLLEFKTHSSKSFTELCNLGVKEAKFEHYVQMNLYMYKMGIPIALYMAVNKDNDKLYAEFIHLDERLAERYVQRGEDLVQLSEAPKKLSNSASFFKCKMCSKYPLCHQGEEVDINCRTCKHSQIGRNAEWICTATGEILSKEAQLKGCQNYEVNVGVYA